MFEFDFANVVYMHTGLFREFILDIRRIVAANFDVRFTSAKLLLDYLFAAILFWYLPIKCIACKFFGVHALTSTLRSDNNVSIKS